MLTLPVMGRVTGRVIVSARLAKLDLQCGLEVMRGSIFRPAFDDQFYPIEFESPKSSGDNFARFLIF